MSNPFLARSRNPASRRRIAFGPVMPGFGSWEWIGAELVDSLSGRFETMTFRDEIPDCDAAVFVKFRPDASQVRELSSRAAVLFAPVDAYGSAVEIDADVDVLAALDGVVVHSHRLRKYFAPYAPTEYIDHPLRYTAPLRDSPRTSGPIVWAGVRSNLGPLADWVNRHPLPEELWILTNPEDEAAAPRPADFGFRNDRRVRIERWTPERQRAWTGLAQAALDVKGNEFRARHKPPVKAFDFIASGVPFATNRDSSPADHLRGLGFHPATPDDPNRWLSREYFDETLRLGRVLRDHLGRRQIADAWSDRLTGVLERRTSMTPQRPTAMRATKDVDPSPKNPSAPTDATSSGSQRRSTRVALLSLLFNWPSTGGGTVHTYEAAKFLRQAGYDVLHIYARYDEWGLGQVTQPLDYPARELHFNERTWSADEIRSQFRDVVDAFAPDAVILTDSWNTKPLLAEAVAGYSYFLRLAAMECLCPLNNVRLLVDEGGALVRCPRTQLESPAACRACVRRNGRFSGSLHHAERLLAGFDDLDYPRRLHDAFSRAAGVLAVNPAIADMVRPFAHTVDVVPSGFDPARFDLAVLDANLPPRTASRTRLFFAGLTHEAMKGFAVLREACERLWDRRQDFELVATGDPPGRVNDFLTHVGWLSQDDLPRHLRASDVVVFPTVAEEALGRSAVEAMACGRPVVASRIGGLPFTVIEGETGLLAEPGDASDLAEKLAWLLDDPALRQRLGDAGRRRFDAEFTWDVVLDRHYRRLVGPAVRCDAAQSA